MRRKMLQDLANTLCQMFVGWHFGDDYEKIATLPEGTLTIDLIRIKASHSSSEIPEFWIAKEFAAWFGRRRKLSLYMRRFTQHGKWELRIDNGWMRFFFNDADGACVVYGIHKDVVRINAR